ncbi:MAG TPA: DUF2911 domain-containing protein, partial [Flavobacteriales bacterium]|nr:DUF2911 domain-containing protein [Flavobacteriales bacterium]
FNKNPDQSGTASYKEEDNVAEVKAEVKACDVTETLTIDISDVNGDEAALEIRWERIMVKVPLKVDSEKQAMLNIDAALKQEGLDVGAYNRMARYCVEHGQRTSEALEWASKSVAMEEHYWNLYTLALAQEANGERDKALETAQRAVDIADKENDKNTAAQIRSQIDAWRAK